MDLREKRCNARLLTVATHWNHLGPTFEDSNIIGLGCDLGVRIVKSSPSDFFVAGVKKTGICWKVQVAAKAVI